MIVGSIDSVGTWNVTKVNCLSISAIAFETAKPSSWRLPGPAGIAVLGTASYRSMSPSRISRPYERNFAPMPVMRGSFLGIDLQRREERGLGDLDVSYGFHPT